MCCLSCFIIFWTTKYNTPRTFCLAGYSVVFCDRCICLLPHISTNHSNCIHALGSDPSDNIHYPFSYQLTSWFCSEVSTTCYFPFTQVPICRNFRLVSERSSHYTCFIVTSTGLISEGILADLSRLA